MNPQPSFLNVLNVVSPISNPNKGVGLSLVGRNIMRGRGYLVLNWFRGSEDGDDGCDDWGDGAFFTPGPPPPIPFGSVMDDLLLSDPNQYPRLGIRWWGSVSGEKSMGQWS